jgi:Fe-S cluster biogenesis protein NfuA/nitrite reductase/ring-hydroxylating ferredoxin subunit
MSAVAQPEPRELVAEVERRLAEIEALEDRRAQEAATAAVQALLELYGTGLERIVENIAARDDGQLATALVDDELVAHLLLVHGLHPVPLEQRVLDALAEVRPYLESHGGNVELLAIDGPAVRLRMQGSCSGCPSSAMTLKLAIENALTKAAPEIEDVIAEDPPSEDAAPLLQIEVAPALRSDGWTMAGGLAELNGGGTTVKRISGQDVLFLRLDESYYAYRPRCPRCEEPLAGAQLSGSQLTCPACAQRYDARRAGRGLDDPQLSLEPVPLLVGEDGLVRIALPVAA